MKIIKNTGVIFLTLCGTLWFSIEHSLATDQAKVEEHYLWRGSALRFESDAEVHEKTLLTEEKVAFLNDLADLSDLKSESDTEVHSHGKFVIKGVYMIRRGEEREMHVGIYQQDWPEGFRSLTYFRFINNSIPLICSVLNGTYSPKEVFDLMACIYGDGLLYTNIGRFLKWSPGHSEHMSFEKRRTIGPVLEKNIFKIFGWLERFDCAKVWDHYKNEFKIAEQLIDTPFIDNSESKSGYIMIPKTIPEDYKPLIDIIRIYGAGRSNIHDGLVVLNIETKTYVPYQQPTIDFFAFSHTISQSIVLQWIFGYTTYEQIQKMLTYHFGDILGVEKTDLMNFMSRFPHVSNEEQKSSPRSLVNQEILELLLQKKQSKL